MDLKARDRILARLEKEGKVTNDYVFLVKNLEKNEKKQYWVPVPGSVISMFLSGSHEYKALGPAKSKQVQGMIKKVDDAQRHIVGEQKIDEVDDFVLALDLDDLGLEEAEKPKAASPGSNKNKSGDKANEK